MRRLIVVYNPRSSNFKKVETEVLVKLRELKGLLIGKYEVVATNVDDNVACLAKMLAKNDLVLAVGGDATATIAANGILMAGFSQNEQPTLAVLPYGNFSDLARTLKTRHLSDVISDKVNTAEFWPLEIMVDDEHFRYAMCYATIGMMAESTELFDEPSVRKNLRKGKKTSLRSYRYLAKWYFKNRKHRFLPTEFDLNNKPVCNATDYIAANGTSMARVMRTRESYLERGFFRSNTFRLGFFGNLMGFMVRSILFSTPVRKTFEDTLRFSEPTTVEIQAEGEYKKFVQVKKVVVKKSVQYIKVVVK